MCLIIFEIYKIYFIPPTLSFKPLILENIDHGCAKYKDFYYKNFFYTIYDPDTHFLS